MAAIAKQELTGLAMAPGPALAALLGELDLTTVPAGRVVEVVQASWRQVSHAYATYLAAMAEVARCGPDGVDEEWAWADCELAAALTFTAHRTQVEFDLARHLRRRLPRVWQALRAGSIDVPKARVFADYLHERTDGQITRICDRLLPFAPRWTTGQLAARLLREVQAVDREYTRRRYERAARDRGVWGYLAVDGTAVLSAHGLSPAEAAAAAERLEEVAAAVKVAGHPAGEQQLRADLFVRLLDGRYTGFDQEQIIAAMLAEVSDVRGPSEPDGAGSAGSAGADREPDSARQREEVPITSASSGLGPRTAHAAGSDSAGPAGAAGSEVPMEPMSSDLDPDAVGLAEPAVSAEPAERGLSAEPPERAVRAEPAERGLSAEPPERAVRAEPAERAVSAEPTQSVPPGPSPPSPRPAEPRPPVSRPAEPRRAERARLGVEVRVALSTLLGLDDHPAELPGWGPAPAAEARLLVDRQHGAEWRYAITDQRGYLRHAGLTRRRPSGCRSGPTCRGGIVEIHVPSDLLTDLARCPDLPPRWAGIIIDLHDQYTRRLHSTLGLDDHPRARHPGAGLRRHIQIRDRTCVAPGCRRPARSADVDHTVAFQHGGRTVCANLEPLCGKHHAMKHQGAGASISTGRVASAGAARWARSISVGVNRSPPTCPNPSTADPMTRPSPTMSPPTPAGSGRSSRHPHRARPSRPSHPHRRQTTTAPRTTRRSDRPGTRPRQLNRA